MIPLLADAAESTWLAEIQIALFLGVSLLSFSLWVLLPNGRPMTKQRRIFGAMLGTVGLIAIWWRVPRMQIDVQVEFWGLAALTIFSAVATITSRSAVYCAIWFAASLLGTAGLYLFQGAQFLGIATIAVYAGAIVVTFLLVLMLAQPEGNAYFDRISWGPTPRLVASTAAVCFAIVIAASIFEVSDEQLRVETELRDSIETALERHKDCHLRGINIAQSDAETLITIRVAAPFDQRDAVLGRIDELRQAAIATVPSEQPYNFRLKFVDVLAPRHVANLGGQLFSRNLIAIQLAATLLLMALVGAIAIASRDATPSQPQESVG